MLPSVTCIPQPQGNESNLTFYCGCGKAYAKQIQQELHSKNCRVLKFASDLAERYDKIYLNSLLRDEIMRPLKLLPKIHLGDRNLTLTTQGLKQLETTKELAVKVLKAYSEDSRISKGSSNEELGGTLAGSKRQCSD